VLVSGASGSIGSELCKQILKFNPKALVALDQDETGLFWLKRRIEDTRLLPVVGNIRDATKRLAEKVVVELNKKNHTQFAAVRFGNVLGSRGSVIPIFREQIIKGGTVEVTHPDIKRYFMVTSEEGLDSTCHKKISKARLNLRNGELPENLVKLKGLCEGGKNEEIISLMRDMIPTYNPAR